MKVFKESHLNKWQKQVVLIMFFPWLPFGVFADDVQNDTTKTVDIFSANQLLARTLNIGFTLDAPKEGDWGHSLNADEFILIKQSGFTESSHTTIIGRIILIRFGGLAAFTSASAVKAGLLSVIPACMLRNKKAPAISSQRLCDRVRIQT